MNSNYYSYSLLLTFTSFTLRTKYYESSTLEIIYLLEAKTHTAILLFFSLLHLPSFARDITFTATLFIYVTRREKKEKALAAFRLDELVVLLPYYIFKKKNI